MISLYIRHKLQIPRSATTDEIDKKIKVIFKPPKTLNDIDLSRLVHETEYQIKLLFERYSNLIK